MSARAAALLVGTALLLAGCGADPVRPLGPPRPDWIDAPGHGAVGSAGTHVKGRHAQEELAIARARERLAEQQGVSVNSVQTISEAVGGQTYSVQSQRDTTQTVTGVTVRAQVRAMWYDAARDEVWVWLYPVGEP